MALTPQLSRWFKTSNMTIAALIGLVVLFNFLAAHFISIQSSQLSARASIEAEISELGWDTIKSDREVQSVVQWINAKAALQASPAERFYFMSDSDKNPLAGNLNHWPEHAQPYNGWYKFDGVETDITSGPVYARIFSGAAKNGDTAYKIMIGRQLPAVESIFRAVFPALLAISLICAVCGGFIFKAQQSNT